MPSDKYFDDAYDYLNKEKQERKNVLKQYYIDKFSKMTLEEKVDFLINEYIQKEIKKQ